MTETTQESAEFRPSKAGPTVDPDEVARFSMLADEWWNPEGSFAPLHKLNPVRIGFIRDRLAAHFHRQPLSPRPLEGLNIIDIGCGGGLLCEPLCRLGARVTGIDASERNIRIASDHAEHVGLDIDYRHATAEELCAAGEQFDAVISLEVVEHVADVNAFLGVCGDLAKPGGALIFATLNRTPKSFLFGIVGAEYILGWLPRGTHQWKRFVRPSELAGALRGNGVRISELTGVSYDIARDEWRLGRDLSVNYMAYAEKGG